MVPGGMVFANMRDAAHHLGVLWITLHERFQRGEAGYCYINAELPRTPEPPRRRGRAHVIFSPKGMFACSADAARAHGISDETVRKYLRRGKPGWRRGPTVQEANMLRVLSGQGEAVHLIARRPRRHQQS